MLPVTEFPEGVISMHRFRLATLVLAAAVAAPVAAQTTPAKPAGAVRTIDIVANDEMKYNVTTITAKPGEQLRVRLIVRGVVPKVAMAHNFVLLKPGTNGLQFVEAGAMFRDQDFIAPALKSAVLAKTALAGPGETVQVVFTAPAKPGSYPYLCTFSGHFQAGMKGVLIIK
jgi:azurin